MEAQASPLQIEAATEPVPVAFLGATVMDGTGSPPIDDSVVITSEGRIQCVGRREDCTVPPGIPTLDLSGYWITPGLVDAHAHLSLSGWVDTRPDILDLRAEFPYAAAVARLRQTPHVIFQSYLCSGVTAVFDLGGFPWTWELRELARSSAVAPTISAVGPFLSLTDGWLQLPAERRSLLLSDRDAVRSAADYLISSGADGIKVDLSEPGDSAGGQVPRGWEDELLELAARWARSGGIPLVVRTPEVERARGALLAGASILSRSVDDREVDDGFVELLRRRGALYIPTLYVHEAAVGLRERRWVEMEELDTLCLDPGTLEWLRSTEVRPGREARTDQEVARDQERARIRRENLLRLHAAGMPLVVGSDAGEPLVPHGTGIHRELRELQEAGIPPEDILVAATLNGARALGLQEVLGTVEAGKVADLLVLQEDPTLDVGALHRSLRMVVRGGRVFGRDDLAFVGP